jgi:hypothetical protein
MKPRIFVSSVIEGFEEYRESARKGSTEAGGEPVLVEDYPSLSVSPRNACLDGVESCDIYIVIVGQRGGWVAPSGKLVVEEEFEEAQRRKMPILSFIQETTHDEKAEEFVKNISNYLNGLFRKTFTTLKDLEDAVIESLQPIIRTYKLPNMNISLLKEKVESNEVINGYANLRIAFSPERDYELIDPVHIESKELEHTIYEIGHSAQINLFSYEQTKHSEVGINEIIITQARAHGSHYIFERLRLEITTKGIVVLDINVTGERRNHEDYGVVSYMAVTEEDILRGLRKAFLFADAFYKEKDPFLRFDRIFYNASISGIENKALIQKLIKKDSIQVPPRNENIVIAFEQSRLITRGNIENYEDEIKATVTMLRRRLKN